MSSKRITLLDVACDAGVSRATASLVVRSSPLVAAETRAKVLASIDKLGYVYNRAAASLRTQRSQTVGLVVTDITNPFFAQMTVGSEAQFEEANYAVLLTNTSERLDKQAHLLEMINENGVDGVLFCPARGTPPNIIAQLKSWRLPCVFVTRYLSGADVDYVGADNVLGAAQAIEHLVARGYQRIAFVGGPVDSSARRERLQGYRQGLMQQGLAYDVTLEVTCPISREGGHQAIQKLLARPDAPTAALCYNDVVAFGVMLGLRAVGRVPGQDFAVVGFDDIEEAALWQPALTTVAINPRAIGEQAASLLLERIADPDGDPRRIILSPELIVRETS